MTAEHEQQPPVRISILIATRNRPEDLVPCLRSLMALDHKAYEIVILDQSTSDAPERAVREAFGFPERLRYIRSNATGKSRALNELIAAARGELFAFTDDDTEVPSDWLTNLERVFHANPEADIVFGQVFMSEEAGQIPNSYVPALYFTESRYLKRGETFGMGANMGMRREVAARTHGFDTLLGPGTQMYAAEEGDFMYRAQQAGVRLYADPSVQLIHRAWRDRTEWTRVLYCYGTGDAAFALKHLRCGDLGMLGKIAHGLFYIYARGCLRILQGRGRPLPGEFFYVRGYWQGLWNSLRFPVDKRTRLYRPLPHEAQGSSGDPSGEASGQDTASTSTSAGSAQPGVREAIQ